MELEIFGVVMTAWQIFVSLGIIFMILEIFAPGFILLPIGVALMTTSVFTVWVTKTEWQIAVFAANLLVIFFYFQKIVKPKFKTAKLSSNVDSMVGKEAQVITEVAPHKPGYVKVYSDKWQAVTEGETEIPVGTTVTIVAVDGNKVIVTPS